MPLAYMRSDILFSDMDMDEMFLRTEELHTDRQTQDASFGRGRLMMGWDHDNSVHFQFLAWTDMNATLVFGNNDGEQPPPEKDQKKNTRFPAAPAA